MSSLHEDNRCYIREYWRDISEGRVVVGDKVRRVYEKLNNDLDRKDWDYYYDEMRANHVIEFIETYCRQSKGKDGGKPIKLLLWQKALLNALFGFVDAEGNRKHRELFLVVGHKCGKTTLASGISLYMLFADGERGPSVVSAATTREQAKISWDEAKKMIRKSPALRERSRTLVGDILTDYNDGNFKPLSSDSSSLDGLNPSAAIMDEIAAWKNGKELYDVIIDGEIAREQPLNIMITTAGTIREDLYDLLYDQSQNILNGYTDKSGYQDERFLPIIYEIDKREEFQDEACWEKANPSLDHIKDREALRYKVNKAIENPMLVKNLLCKDFNVRETSDQAFLTFEQLNNTATFDVKKLKPRYGIFGIDLGATTDLTCCTGIFRVPDDEILYVTQMYWLPADLIEMRTQEDKIPYAAWLDQGLMRASEGNKVNYKDVVDWLIEVQTELDIYVYKIGYDSWGSTYLVDELKNSFGQWVPEPVVQGAKTFSGPLKRVQVELGSKKINYNNNSIFKWCMSNSAVKVDRNDNWALVKTSNPRRRIDGFSSFMDAYIVYEKYYQDYMNII